MRLGLVQKKIKAPSKRRLPVALEHAQCQALLDAVRVPLYRVVFECMYYSGLRIGEALSLTVDDVDKAHMTLRVIGKGNKERLAPMSPALYHDLRQAWRTHGTRPWLFPNRRRTGPVSFHTLQYAFRSACEQAGLDSALVKPHVLRHSFATRLHEKGVPSETVRILLGHSSVETTKRYLHLLEASSDKVSGALDTFCAPLLK